VARTILVADDNPLIRKMLCEMFEVEEDYDLCAEARDGAEAIALAIKHKPELIILDMSMPVMDGIRAAKELKELMPEVPIILFTLYADEINPDHVSVDRIVSKGEAWSLMGHVRQLLPV
jgi:two-component system, LytTR family, response regulator AlgR